MTAQCKMCGQFVSETEPCGRCGETTEQMEERIERFDNIEEEKPCGLIHSLPCGLDRKCQVPVDFFSPHLNSDTIFDRYQETL